MNPAWLAFPIVIAVLVFIHELGHFSAAKKLRVGVQEFAMGFPPRLFSFRRGETKYSVNLLPLGGYVKMVGENGDNSDDPLSFSNHPWWHRAIILIAGPFMNIALAMVIFFVTAYWLGSPVITNVIQQVEPNSPAQHQGLKAGDHIVAINGVKTPDFNAIVASSVTPGEHETLTVVRPGREGRLYIRVLVRKNPPKDQGHVGFESSVAEVRYPFGVSIQKSYQGVGDFVMAIPNLFSGIGQHGASAVSGPVGIAHETTDVAGSIPQYGWGQFLGFVALLSVNLGIINLLPIPALDGGRLLLVLVAAVRRKNINPQVEGLIHLTGMAFLLLLIVFVSFHDITQW